MAGEASQEAPEWYKEPCVLGIGAQARQAEQVAAAEAAAAEAAAGGSGGGGTTLHVLSFIPAHLSPTLLLQMRRGVAQYWDPVSGGEGKRTAVFCCIAMSRRPRQSAPAWHRLLRWRLPPTSLHPASPASLSLQWCTPQRSRQSAALKS